MFTTAFPMLTTADLPAALRFYRDLLGFTEIYRFPDGGPPSYVGLRLGAAELGLGVDAALDGPAANRYLQLCVYTGDCDAAVAVLRTAGVPVLQEPADQPWGERMACVADPDGNRVVLMTGGAAQT